ncbi:MAG: hypothetical protein CMJ44_02790 [Pimelobacter sp.]|nr:hypothetical protein [Pimelobacter sp.]
MSAPTISFVDVHDDVALAAWHGAESASVNHERPLALQRSLPALTASVQHPSAFVRRVLLAARRDGEVVGTAELVLSQTENEHLAELEIHVRPEHRRRGTGAALHQAVDEIRRADGRTTVIGELYLPLGGSAAGLDFATALGFTSVHTEEHLAMRLPADPITADLLTREVPGYEIVTWTGRCPDEHRAAYLSMRNQMNLDVPTGQIDATPVVIHEARLADSELRTARSYITIVAAARRVADGAMGGYSVVLLDRSDHVALQDDTLVMPEHRGSGLGMQLKQATRAIVEAEHPERQAIHTWTDPANAAMYRTNISFGFAPVEILHEMQRVD